LSRRPILLALLLTLCAGSAAAENKLLWGDTHLHSSNSFDAYLNGNGTADPATAYRYARGLPVVHPGNRTRVQIQTPLDFLVVADHAEFLGVMPYIVERGIPTEDLGIVDTAIAAGIEWWLSGVIEDGEGGAAFSSVLPEGTENDVVGAAANPPSFPIPGFEGMIETVWNEAILTADAHNDPGHFTALIGWEWSSIPAGANLHRVVFTSAGADVAAKFVPWSSANSMYPEDLWNWLDETSAATGARFTAIPHNSNISKGYMFPEENRLRGTAIDEEWVKKRAKWERVVEATQFKGDSETDPSVSPDDPFADFETYPHYIQNNAPAFAPGRGDFVRSALRTGLAIEERIGFNPYRFGLIGATDAHTGIPSAEEPNFWGKFPTDSVPENKFREAGIGRTRNGWSMSASGLAAVWAPENTREAILDAFERREVYATTGPRIVVRVYAGSGFQPGDEEAIDPVTLGEGSVPMGGELTALQAPPSFLIHAAKDPKSAHLDRVQMVKGWLADGATHEKVYDVAWAGDRVAGADGRVPPVPDTVDPETADYTNEHGAPTLAAVWTDPDFDPTLRAFYYVRVLEVPTPRHSLRDAIALQKDPGETGHPNSIQERAYTSPIHYQP
jgi:hypothetical protein